MGQTTPEYKKPTIRLEFGFPFNDFNSGLKIDDVFGMMLASHVNVWQKLYVFAEISGTESHFDLNLNPTLRGPVRITRQLAGVYGYYKIREEIKYDYLVSPHIGVGIKKFRSTEFPEVNDTAPLFTVGMSLFIAGREDENEDEDEDLSAFINDEDEDDDDDFDLSAFLNFIRFGITLDIYKTSFNQRDSTALSDLLTSITWGIEF